MRKGRMILVAVLLVLTATSGFAGGQGEAEKAAAKAGTQTVSFWHIDTIDVGQAYWKGLADRYMQLNPDVTVEITVLENEAFKSKVATLMQSGNPPDIFTSWGGGVMAEYAKAGLLRDISDQVHGTDWGDSMAPGVLGVYAYEGKQYGVPYDMGAVTFWYNKEMLEQAGYTTFPGTWSEFTTMVRKLRSNGVVPVALAGGDKWPAMFWWAYLSMRLGGKEAYDSVFSGEGAFTDEPFVKAGQMLVEFAQMGAFQDGFLGATQNDQAGLVANGQAAMELMGQWAPGVQAQAAVDRVGLGDKLAVAPFPAVEGGKGAGTDVMGGGNGWAVGKNASDAAVDFLRYISSLEANTEFAGQGRGVPTVIGADVGIEDPMIKLVKNVVDQAGYFQLYLDQFFPPAVGGVINDSVQQILAGTATPAQAAAAIQRSYEANR